jgi:hypothetical protein
VTVNGYTTVPFCSIEPVKVSVASVTGGVGVVNVEPLELDPHPVSQNIETIDSARQKERPMVSSSAARPGDHVKPCDFE